jgi:hypothetical protein
MNDYEVWSITYSLAKRQAQFIADSAEQAMKNFIRNQHKVFYYDNWKNQHSIYFANGSLYIVFDARAFRDYKEKIVQSAYDTYLKPHRQSACDCGALKCKTTHAHWCSTKENANG